MKSPGVVQQVLDALEGTRRRCGTSGLLSQSKVRSSTLVSLMWLGWVRVYCVFMHCYSHCR